MMSSTGGLLCLPPLASAPLCKWKRARKIQIKYLLTLKDLYPASSTVELLTKELKTAHFFFWKRDNNIKHAGQRPNALMNPTCIKSDKGCRPPGGTWRSPGIRASLQTTEVSSPDSHQREGQWLLLAAFTLFLSVNSFWSSSSKLYCGDTRSIWSSISEIHPKEKWEAYSRSDNF